MKIRRTKNKEIKATPPVVQPVTDETMAEGIAEAESIEDYIERKRLQNRILEKLIDQIKNPENPEKTNNK